jgi:hypothetical protein
MEYNFKVQRLPKPGQQVFSAEWKRPSGAVVVMP